MSTPLERRLRTYRLTGLVLHHRDQGEADRLITLLTPDRGKVVLLAKGARKIPSRKAGHLERFTHVRVQAARGRTWDIITQADTVQTFPRIRTSLKRTAHAYYVSELLLLFAAEEQADRPLFDLALETFHHLNTADNLLLVSRWFEAHVLRVVGYQPQLYVCAACNAPLDLNATVHWHPPSGGVLCATCAAARGVRRALSPAAWKLMRYLQTHTFAHASTLPVRPELLREVETYMLDYLQTVLERELRSVAFLRRLRRELGDREGPVPAPRGNGSSRG